jgi:hypothetical protein
VEACQASHGFDTVIVDDDDQVVAKIPNSKVWNPRAALKWPTDRPNAALMSAAPTLLKAGNTLIEDFRDWMNFKDPDQFEALCQSVYDLEQALQGAVNYKQTLTKENH